MDPKNSINLKDLNKSDRNLLCGLAQEGVSYEIACKIINNRISKRNINKNTKL